MRAFFEGPAFWLTEAKIVPGAMQTPLAGTSPTMVAVGNTKNPGPTTHWPSSQGFGPQVQMTVKWAPRSGRNRL